MDDSLPPPNLRWKTCPPPPELLHSPPETSDEIESILEASVQQLQARIAQEHRLMQITVERNRLEQEHLAAVENSLRQRQEQQRLAAERDRAEQQLLNATSKSLIRQQLTSEAYRLEQQRLAADVLEISVEDPPGEQYKNSKGKGKSIQESEEDLPKMDFPVALPHRTRSHMSGQSGSIAPTPLAQGHTSTRAALAAIWGSRSLSPQSLPAYEDASSTAVSTPGSQAENDQGVCIMHGGFQRQRNGALDVPWTSLSSENSWPPKCCLNEVPKSIIISNIPGKLKARYETMIEERSLSIEDRVYCSKPTCAFWIPPRNINKSLVLARCSRCRHKTCMICRGSYHSDGECPEDPNLRETLRYAIKAGWRRCYKCNALVEHNQGCSHMICHCKAQFCYTCGLKWKTCQCREIELEAYLTAAQWRTQDPPATQADIRQAAYLVLGLEEDADETEFSNELQEIMHLLENTQDRAAEDKLAAWTISGRAERERTEAFQDKLRRLREEMDFVHSIQRIANFDRFEAENKALEDAAKEELADINKLFNVMPQEEKDRERAKYVASFKESGIELPEATINDLVEGAVRSRALEQQMECEPGSGYHKSPEKGKKETEGVAECVDFFKRYGIPHSHIMIDLALGGKATSTARAEQFAQERKHGEQKHAINARLEAEQERLRLGHQSDNKWFEEVATVRDELVMQMVVDEFSR
ncbi:hypothetical protein V490_05328 [Pseudogymnoascus sp. VKM F-3557]|nr:hypothetical protein V490_05328 [Pseudogymnoascus sp. VKM F-3557]